MDANAELVKFRERDAKRKLAQKKYRQSLKERTPPPQTETDEELAEKKRVADEQKKNYMKSYAKTRATKLKERKTELSVKLKELNSLYYGGRLGDKSKDELIEMLVGLYNSVSS